MGMSVHNAMFEAKVEEMAKVVEERLGVLVCFVLGVCAIFPRPLFAERLCSIGSRSLSRRV